MTFHSKKTIFFNWLNLLLAGLSRWLAVHCTVRCAASIHQQFNILILLLGLLRSTCKMRQDEDCNIGFEKRERERERKGQNNELMGL